MIAELTRRYRFSAAHRLHNDALSAAENARLYGKCNNPHGHGHNYVLEVTVRGTVRPATGMVMDIRTLDDIVHKTVIEPFDRSHLNFDVEHFARAVPTTENLCLEIERRIAARLKDANESVALRRVRLEETRSNYFELEPSEAVK